MATTLKVIGIVEIVGGFFAALISTNITRNEAVPIVIMLGCFVSGILFCSFGKCIKLMEDMVSNQNKIIAKFIPDSEENPDGNEDEGNEYDKDGDKFAEYEGDSLENNIAQEAMD